MPFTNRLAKVVLSPTVKQELVALRGSRTAAAQRVAPARILLAHDAGRSVSAIARASPQDPVLPGATGPGL